MRIKLGRRLYGIAATLIVGTAAALVTATPAHAIPPGCYPPASGHSQVAGSYITAYRYMPCDDDFIPLSVSIQRYLSPGVYQTVASGTGSVTYYCNGSSYNVYRTTGTSDFAILCG